jgi:hypothetical protein
MHRWRQIQKLAALALPKSSETSRASGAAKIGTAINLDAAVPVEGLAPRQELIEVNDAAFTNRSVADCRLTHVPRNSEIDIFFDSLRALLLVSSAENVISLAPRLDKR